MTDYDKNYRDYFQQDLVSNLIRTMSDRLYRNNIFVGYKLYCFINYNLVNHYTNDDYKCRIFKILNFYEWKITLNDWSLNYYT